MYLFLCTISAKGYEPDYDKKAYSEFHNVPAHLRNRGLAIYKASIKDILHHIFHNRAHRCA